MRARIALWILAVALTSMVQAAPAQTESERQSDTSAKEHRVVFEIVGESPDHWAALLNNVENVRKALGDATQVEVVAHGMGLGILLKDSVVKDRLEKIAGTGVVFAACENTMKKKGVSKEQLLKVATTVDSGVAEVVRKQEAGWAYVKSES